MQPTTYTVTVTAQFPAWDERDGYTFEVIAENAKEAVSEARKVVRRGCHFDRFNGRLSYRARKEA